MMAHIEAAIDYPEYDIEELGYDRVRKRIEDIRAKIHRLLDTADSGKILREGVKRLLSESLMLENPLY